MTEQSVLKELGTKVCGSWLEGYSSLDLLIWGLANANNHVAIKTWRFEGKPCTYEVCLWKFSDAVEQIVPDFAVQSESYMDALVKAGNWSAAETNKTPAENKAKQ